MVTLYPDQFKINDDGTYVQLPAIQGEQGKQGEPGLGLPSGGIEGQILVKQSSTDYDIAWETVYSNTITFNGWTYPCFRIQGLGTIFILQLPYPYTDIVSFNFTTSQLYDPTLGWINVPIDTVSISSIRQIVIQFNMTNISITPYVILANLQGEIVLS